MLMKSKAQESQLIPKTFGQVTLVPFERSNEADCFEVCRIIRKHYPNSNFPPDPDEISTGAGNYFRVEIDGNFIGITGFKFAYPTLVETIKSIVFDQYRGRGYGKLVSQGIEDYCKSLGVHKIMSCIYADNHTMISIKLKQGYTIEGYHPHHEEIGVHEYTLGKLLFEQQ